SQVKRGLRTLMFTSLKKISGALEVNINFFFNDGDTSMKKSVKKTKKQFRSFLIHKPGRSDEASCFYTRDYQAASRRISKSADHSQRPGIRVCAVRADRSPD